MAKSTPNLSSIGIKFGQCCFSRSSVYILWNFPSSPGKFVDELKGFFCRKLSRSEYQKTARLHTIPDALHWRLGGVSNREIDFGFGCGAVRACVRAKLCAGVRTMIPPGLGRNIGSLWGSCRARPCRAVPPPPRRYQKLRIKLWFCRDLIASGHAATQEVCFLWVSVPKSLQNFRFGCRPAGPDPPAPMVPLVAGVASRRSRGAF